MTMPLPPSQYWLKQMRGSTTVKTSLCKNNANTGGNLPKRRLLRRRRKKKVETRENSRGTGVYIIQNDRKIGCWRKNRKNKDAEGESKMKKLHRKRSNTP